MKNLPKIIGLIGFSIIILVFTLLTRDYLETDSGDTETDKSERLVEGANNEREDKGLAKATSEAKGHHDFQKQEGINIEDLKMPELTPEQEKLIIRRGKVLDELSQHEAQDFDYKKFQNYLDQSKQLLPSQEELKDYSSHDVHMIPYPLSLAGEFFGHLKEILNERPDLNDQAQEYYLDCANENELVETIRALCLTYYTRRENELGREVDLSNFSARIQNLVEAGLSLP